MFPNLFYPEEPLTSWTWKMSLRTFQTTSYYVTESVLLQANPDGRINRKPDSRIFDYTAELMKNSKKPKGQK